MPLKLKLDEQGHVVVQDGKPVYVDEADNKEYPLDGGQLYGRVRELTQENHKHRQDKEAAETSLKAFEGLDPEKARQALETVANIDAGKLLEAGKVEDIKRQAREAAQQEVQAAQQAAQQQIEAITKERDELQSSLHTELIGGAFARSKFIADKVAVPVDMVQAAFGANFKIEDGKVVGYLNGQKIVSPEDFVSPATFETALEKMIEAYPHKDQILKGDGQGGGGADHGKPRDPGGPKGNLGGSRDERLAAIRKSLPSELRTAKA